MIQSKAKEKNISFGYEKNGRMRLYFHDAVELGLDSTYINETSFPNRGLIEQDKYSLWTSIFTRHFKKTFDDE